MGAASGTPDMRGMSDLAVRDLGQLPYRAAWALQKELVEARLAGTAPDTLLLVEHEPVITVGRGTRGEFLASGVRRAPRAPGAAGDAVFITLPDGARAEVIEVERGGQATYHGPGQVVAYPIVMLREGRRDLHAWMRALEQAVIAALQACGFAAEAGAEAIAGPASGAPAVSAAGAPVDPPRSGHPHAGRRHGATGVWIDGQRKICSIGVAASRWVTYHGLALNVAPDLSHFAAIAPCGFEAAVMTSMARERPDGDHGAEHARTALVAALRAELHAFGRPAVP